MRNRVFVTVLVAVALLGGPLLSSAETTTKSVSSQVQALLEQIKNLQAQIQSLKTLQEQVTTVKGDIRQTIQLTKQLRRGMTGEEVTSLQEILAADSSIYPEGLVTGYFGAMTENAVKRFQKKHNIEQLGEVGPKTKAAIYIFLDNLGTSTAVKLSPGLAKKLSNYISSSTKVSVVSGNITICHYPPGNSSAMQTITVGAPAWNAHQKHGDKAGACGTTVTPTPTTDTAAPVISGISTQNLLGTSTSIVWTTNESSNSTVWYGTSTPVAFASSTVVSSSSLVTNHSLSLPNLATSSTYYYVVGSTDAAGNTATTSQISFVTPAN